MQRQFLVQCKNNVCILLQHFEFLFLLDPQVKGMNISNAIFLGTTSSSVPSITLISFGP